MQDSDPSDRYLKNRYGKKELTNVADWSMRQMFILADDRTYSNKINANFKP